MSPSRRLQIAAPGILAGVTEPRSDTAGAGEGVHGAIHFCQVDASAACFKSRGTGNAHHANAAAGCSRFHEPGRFADFNLAAAAYRRKAPAECSTETLPPPVSRAARGPPTEATRMWPPTVCSVAFPAIDAGGDMSAASGRKQISSNILHGDVPAAGFKPCRPADDSGRNISASGRQRDARRPMSSVSMLPPPVEISRL